MNLILDIVLLVIVALCTWGGFKHGLIGSLAGILIIVISLFGGSLISSAYAHEVVPALEPFVDGYIDSQKNRDAILETIGYGNSELSVEDILAQNPSLRFNYAYECFRSVGLYTERAEELAERSVRYADENVTGMTEAVVTVLCDTATYIIGLALGFLMILIFITAIANIGNLSFRLPNLELLDEIGGAVLGFVKGLLYCILLSWLLSFFGLIIGFDTMEHTTLARFFLAFRFITGGLL